jgi:hypothetical protein
MKQEHGQGRTQEAVEALREIRRQAAEQGLGSLTDEEIEAEIAAVRQGRVQRSE